MRSRIFKVPLARHPKSGASWEGFALDQVLRIARPEAVPLAAIV
jgi:hypothetical protein